MRNAFSSISHHHHFGPDTDDRGVPLSGKESHIDFRALVDCHQERVRNTCYRFVNDADDADDLAQEVFIQVFESLAHFREEADLSTWMYRIAVNKSLDFLRRKKRKKRFAWLVPIHSGDDEREVPIPAAGDPHRDLEERERRAILNRAIARLPDSQRTAIILSKYEGLPGKEIAAVMDVSVSSVEALIHRAKANLERLLKKYFQENS
jgi:RNA polymerase sigma-70 factor, ECF subfamily